jgi:hypothetical protein
VRAAALALVLIAAPAAAQSAAQTLRDDASGISITAPPGYTATPSPPRVGTSRSLFDIKAAGDIDTGCRIAVADAPANAALTQGEINVHAGSQPYRDQIATTLSTLYDIRVIEPVSHEGRTGIAVIGDLKPRPAMPARAQDVRSLLVILETPRLRITLGCVGEKADFASRLAGFEAVLRGIEIR